MTLIRAALSFSLFFSVILPINAAAGKLPPPQEGKVVLVNPGSSHIAIDTIDGERKGIRPSGTYELAPGLHTLRVHYYFRQGNTEWTGNTFVDYGFVGTAGTVLKVMCDEEDTGGKSTWRMWIQDVATGADVRTLAQAAARQKAAEEHDQQLAANFSETLKKAEQGDVGSMYDIGLIYDRGEGVASNPAESIRWFKKAGEQGHATALFMLGLNHHLGQGVNQNHEEAFVWLSLAAAFGDESAIYFRDESEKELAPEVLAKAKMRIRQLEAEIQARKAKG
mgnify:CR=1 FL=1